MEGILGPERSFPAGARALPRPGVLSVVVPAYNEEDTVAVLLRRVLALPHPALEVVVVDDGSSDGTLLLARRVAQEDSRVTVVRHRRNEGKGAAVRTALAHVRGDIVAVQDADLEYDPRDLLRMHELFASPEVEAVYGSRWSRGRPRRWSSYLASRLLSGLTNVLFRAHLSDEPSGYKMFRTGLLRRLGLEAKGFDFCPEVTAKVLLSGRRIHELPISYEPRRYRDGKKISWLDGVRAVAVLISLRLEGLRGRRNVT